MIALVTTYFLIFYILVPGVVFHLSTSQFVRLKLSQRTRTQEATFAVTASLLPFALALTGVWYFPVMRHHPFAIQEGTDAQRRLDYRHVAVILASADPSQQLDTNSTKLPPATIHANWLSIDHVLRRQARFLTWYFASLAFEGVLFGILAGRYGDWQGAGKKGQWVPLAHFYNFIATRFILPSLSEWHVLLTTFSLNREEKASYSVAADILQNDGNLYKGLVNDYFLDADGKLTGILLEDVYRFDRAAFDVARAAQPPQQPPSTEPYWRFIPSDSFYIGNPSISNLNIRFVPQEDETLRRSIEAALGGVFDKAASDQIDVTITSDKANEPPQADVYS